MKITKLQGLSVLSMLVVSTFVSCEEHNPFLEQELFNQEYSKNFFKTYGQFPAGQSWDFSDAPRTAPTDPSAFDLLLGETARTKTRAGHEPEATYSYTLQEAKDAGVLRVPSGEVGTATDPYYYLEEATFVWLKDNLKERDNNTTKGSPFVFEYNAPYNATDQRFAIIPFYQGYGTIHYKLHLVASDLDRDYVIWDNWPTDVDPAKSGTDDFQVNPDWRDPKYSQYEWVTNTYSGKKDGWKNVNKRDDLSGLFHKNIRSKPMIISGLQGKFYFYLEVTSVPSSGYGYIGQHHTSKEGMMLALPCPKPEHIDDYKTLFGVDDSKAISQVMVIGCEDTKNDDWDINDIVFMIVGLTDLPRPIEAKVSKRYLIEDLGTTVDFDFNDVVVDVTETKMTDPATGDETIYTQEAIIKHLCGIVPFKVYFVGEDGEFYWKNSFNAGNSIDGEVQGLYEECKDAAGNYKYKLIYSKHNKDIVNATDAPFWDPARNNIRINVESSETLHGESWSESAQIKTGHFNRPEEATAPYIIAVPTTVMWTAESKNFPIGDFVELPDAEKGDKYPKGN